jgi:hypothetical protein
MANSMGNIGGLGVGPINSSVSMRGANGNVLGGSLARSILS